HRLEVGGRHGRRLRRLVDLLLAYRKRTNMLPRLAICALAVIPFATLRADEPAARESTKPEITRVDFQDKVFDVPTLISTPLNSKTLATYERDGIVTENIQFHSETDGDKEVEIFAIFSYPKGAQKLPAFIWNPGGLGQANPEFTEIPAKRGYAVLCIDFPQKG